MTSKKSRSHKSDGATDGPRNDTSVHRHLEYVATVKLTPNARNARTHSKKADPPDC